MLLVVLLACSSVASAGSYVSAADPEVPPPSPPYTLLDPVINDISYIVDIRNIGDSEAAVNATIALPSTRSPDTYIELQEVTTTAGVVTTNSNLGNLYLNLEAALAPGEQVRVNVTFLALKYDLAVSTRSLVRDLGYPNDLSNYTLPGTYIESDNATLQNYAAAVVGTSTNPFRIAEKIYSYTIAHLRYVRQDDIRGALWALDSGMGDCTEYSTLFTAMMRAVGIPARTVTGHMSSALSLGGMASARQLWADSPHMWAEFYVSGYGWVPVDASSGEDDPENHFALTDSRYLPILKGQLMEAPYRSLATVSSDQPGSIDFNATLYVRPQTDAQSSEGIIGAVSSAVESICEMRVAAESAYAHGFNVTSSYGLVSEAYSTLCNATVLADSGDTAGFMSTSTDAQETANEALQMISDIVIEVARSAVDSAWTEMRTLGALSGQRYLDKAENDRANSDYEQMVINAAYAKTAADESANITIFIALIAFSGLTVWAIHRNHKSRS